MYSGLGIRNFKIGSKTYKFRAMNDYQEYYIFEGSEEPKEGVFLTEMSKHQSLNKGVRTIKKVRLMQFKKEIWSNFWTIKEEPTQSLISKGHKFVFFAPSVSYHTTNGTGFSSDNLPFIGSGSIVFGKYKLTVRNYTEDEFKHYIETSIISPTHLNPVAKQVVVFESIDDYMKVELEEIDMLRQKMQTALDILVPELMAKPILIYDEGYANVEFKDYYSVNVDALVHRPYDSRINRDINDYSTFVKAMKKVSNWPKFYLMLYLRSKELRSNNFFELANSIELGMRVVWPLMKKSDEKYNFTTFRKYFMAEVRPTMTEYDDETIEVFINDLQDLRNMMVHPMSAKSPRSDLNIYNMYRFFSDIINYYLRRHLVK